MSETGPTIMIIDDSALSRRMMRRILEEGGYGVVEESNGLAALEHYPSQRPALVMLDLIMTGLYGLDVLVALRRMDPNARVIIASADVQQATQDEVKSAGASGFVSKPLTASDVLRAVAAVHAGNTTWV